MRVKKAKYVSFGIMASFRHVKFELYNRSIKSDTIGMKALLLFKSSINSAEHRFDGCRSDILINPYAKT